MRASKAAMAALVGANLILFSCSSGGRAPQPGTPAFYWLAAAETYKAGDYMKTIQHLDSIAASDNEYTARALPWLLVLTSGMAEGYAELADHYEAGARMNKANPTPLRKQVIAYRGAAARLALQFAQGFEKFQKLPGDTVTMAFSYPTGSAAPVPVLSKVSNGIMPPAQEVETAQKRTVERGVLLNACKAATGSEDPAKTQELFKAGEVKVPRATFVAAAAESLYQQSQIFSRTKLDDPDKLKIFAGRAQEALKTVPESKETKELGKKIAAELKKK